MLESSTSSILNNSFVDGVQMSLPIGLTEVVRVDKPGGPYFTTWALEYVVLVFSPVELAETAPF